MQSDGDAAFGEEVLYTKMDKWIGTTAVVTGASVGIGAAICEVLVKLGLNVVGMARRVELIQEQAEKLNGEKGKLYPKKVDVRDEQQIDEVFDWIDRNLGAVAIMINNAGLMLPTTLIDGDVDQLRTQVNVNIMGLCICTKKAIASMKAHNQDGYIIHINSILGHYIPELPLPCLNIYPATKHAVTALTELLRRELRMLPSPKIKISAISPGLVSTEFMEGFPEMGGLRAGMKQLPALQGSDIADTVIYVLSTPPHVQIHDIIVKITAEGF